MNKEITFKLPSEPSASLAEETGIHIGDGSMGCYLSGGKTHWEVTYSLHKNDDKEYVYYVQSLLRKLYGIPPYVKTRGNGIILVYTRKELVKFKERLGLPRGKKDNICIPPWILENPEFITPCIRSLMDTDGNIRFRKPFKGEQHSYPEIKLVSSSEVLIKQVKEIFYKMGISSCIHKEKTSARSPRPRFCLRLNGKDRVEQYMELIGFNNAKHLRKYQFWKQYGFYTKNAYELRRQDL